jgi:hypothetical protein
MAMPEEPTPRVLIERNAQRLILTSDGGLILEQQYMDAMNQLAWNSIDRWPTRDESLRRIPQLLLWALDAALTRASEACERKHAVEEPE